MTVEDFIYKAKKLAEREGVSRRTLLKDIHMLLEGVASDWFFTYVDDLDSWEVFESSIVYRFGNPNRDQGIRTQIQERKQQRGEQFLAFVTEIEKLNRMLSRPLSRRRKFEVIWDNMRQHYRSKISIVKVEDLEHLIQLNHRIDAADPQLHQQSLEGGYRRPVNQLEAEGSGYETENSAEVNAIQDRTNRHNYNNPRRQNDRDSREANPQQASRSNQEQRQNTNRASQAHPPLKCWNCEAEGHGWRQCSKPRLIFCYGCGNLGRTTRTCERCAVAGDSNANQKQQGNA